MDKDSELINQELCQKPYIKVLTSEISKEKILIHHLENGSIYIGDISKGMPNGSGKECGKGFIYEGSFLDGKWQGKGKVLKLADEKIELIGEFINGYFVGI